MPLFGITIIWFVDEPVRLNHERWTHVTEEHNELAGLRLEVL